MLQLLRQLRHFHQNRYRKIEEKKDKTSRREPEGRPLEIAEKK